MNKDYRKKSRRAFLMDTGAIIAAPYFVPSSALGNGAQPAPSNRLTMALIGLGSMGMRHVKGFLRGKDSHKGGGCDGNALRRRAPVPEINKHYGDGVCAQYNAFREP